LQDFRAPIFVFVCTLAGAVALAAYMQFEERLRLQGHVDGIAEYTSHWMEDRINADIDVLDRMARRWTNGNGEIWEAWEADASEFLSDMPEVRAIEWADTNFQIQRVIPIEGNEAARGLDLLRVLDEGDRLLEAAGTGELFVTDAIELAQGGTGFVAYQPLYVDGEFRGLMIAVFDVSRLVDLLVQSDFGRETTIAFGQDGAVFGVTSEGGIEQFSSQVEAVFRGREWEVTICAKQVLLSRFLTLGPALTLLGGLILGLALASAVYASQRARQRQRESELAQIALSNELAAANQRFEAAARGASVGIWDWIDVTGNEIWWSPVLYNLLGYDPEEVEVTQDFFISIIHPDDQTSLVSVIGEHFAHDAPFRVEYRLRHRSGDYRWFIGSGAAIRNERGEPTRMVGSIMDIHELKETQRNLERASRAKTDFLANMSHEIRTPMNGILGMTSLMLASDVPEEFRSSVEIIKASGDAMMDIVNDILDISKIEAGRIALECEPISIGEVLRRCRSLYAAQAELKAIDLIVEEPREWIAEHVLGDEVRLLQALGNLVSNAVKFTAKGGIRVSVAQDRVAGGKVQTRFEVVDTGVGIPDAKMVEIFEPFTQADTSTTREYGGTGLGLAIARNLVTMMDGEIGATSKPGEGSTFWFTIVSEPAEPCHQTSEPRHRSA